MKRFYDFLFRFLGPICNLLYPRRTKVYAQLPEGAAIICANHTSVLDPALVSLTAGRQHWIHYMAKSELASNKFLAGLFNRAGVFFVNRNSIDLSAVKTALGLLKNGEKIGIFPEGTRVTEDEYVTAKNGAVRFAARLGVPIVPVFVSSSKKLFKKTDVVVGEPYYVDQDADISEQTEDLMNRIRALNPQGQTDETDSCC